MKKLQTYPGITLIIGAFFIINLILFIFLRSGGVSANELLTLEQEEKEIHRMVYYVEEDHLVGEKKTFLPTEEGELQRILQAYVLPSRKPSDRTNISHLKVRDVQHILDTIYISLAEDSFEDRRIYADNLDLYLMSLVNTLTESYPDDRVQILIEGHQKIKGVMVEKTYERNTRLIQSKDEETSVFLNLFMNEILLHKDKDAYGRLAYPKLSFKDFEVYAKNFRKAHKGNPPLSYESLVDENKVKVKVNFQNNTSQTYELKEQDGSLRIILNKK